MEGQREQMKKDELRLFISPLTSVHLFFQLSMPILPPSWMVLKIYKAPPPPVFLPMRAMMMHFLCCYLFVSLTILNT